MNRKRLTVSSSAVVLSLFIILVAGQEGWNVWYTLLGLVGIWFVAIIFMLLGLD